MDTGPTELCAQSNNLLLEDEKYSANHDRHSSKYNSKDQVGITILKATKKWRWSDSYCWEPFVKNKEKSIHSENLTSTGNHFISPEPIYD